MEEIDSTTLQAFRAFTSVVKKLKSAKQGESTDDEDGGQPQLDNLQRKEFQWDDIIKWLVAAIFGLSLLNISTDFFRNYIITCYVPNDTTHDHIAYINNYCYSSLPRSEYFTLFIVIHGFLIIGPHVLWKTTFDSNFKFFYSLVSNLDRLKDNSTGDFTQKNYKIITRLRAEFSRTIKILKFKFPLIYTFYIIKLATQLLSAVGSVFFSLSFFDDFSELFICPSPAQQDEILKDDSKWPIDHPVTCVYPSLRFLHLLRYGDFALLTLIIIVLLYSLLWCFTRHTTELGWKTIASYSVHSNLHRDSYCSNSFWKQPLSPAITNDMDFLVLTLFRASSGQGMTFKELQVSQQMKKEYNRDSELLQLIVTHKSQIRIYEMQTSLEEGGGSSEVHRERDSMDLYKKAGFSWDVKVGFRNAPRFDIESKNRPLLGLDDMARPPNKLEIHTTANQLHSIHSQSGGEENSFDDFFRSLFAKTRVEPKFPDKQRDCSCLWLRNLRYRGHQRELLESNISEDRYVDMLEQWSKKKGRLSLLIKTLNEFGYDELATKLSRGEIYESTIKQERSFQNRIYGFLQLVKRHRPDHKRLMGLDISFDGMGCSFILAWAFDVVCVLNFHSHYNLGEKNVKEERLLNQVKIITLPVNYYSLPANPSDNFEDCLERVFFMCIPNPDERTGRRSGKDDMSDVYINFLAIGPLTEDARRVTVNLTLEKLHFGMDVAYNCLMLAIRPLKINGTDVRHLFLKYIPPVDLFRPIDECDENDDASVTESHSEAIKNMSDLRKIDSSSFCNVGVDEGLICYCGDIECVMEMELYRYIGNRKIFEDIS